MIGTLTKGVEWKLDRTPKGGVLKLVRAGEIQTQGSVVFSERFGLFLVTSFRHPHWRMDIADLEVALEILWSWRTGYQSDHHALCECDDCEERRSRRFRPTEDDDFREGG